MSWEKVNQDLLILQIIEKLEDSLKMYDKIQLGN